MVEHIIYLPIHSFIEKKDIKVLADRITDIVTRYQMYLQQIKRQPEIVAKDFELFQSAKL
jgi:hypothetical protein